LLTVALPTCTTTRSGNPALLQSLLLVKHNDIIVVFDWSLYSCCARTPASQIKLVCIERRARSQESDL